MAKTDDYILLLSKEKSFLANLSAEKMQTQFGEIDLRKVKAGSVVKTNTGYKFIAVRPTFRDMMRKFRRLPQIVTAKDAGMIIAYTGVSNGWKCVDAGTGSAFLALFLANVVSPDGSVTSYEKNKEFAESAKKNVVMAGLDKAVTIKTKSFDKMTEKDVDLITLDMKDADKRVKKAYKALKPGGWLVIYSPCIEQVLSVRKAMEKDFVSIMTKEFIEREWQSVAGYSRPKTNLIGHTGFLTFGRKV